MKGETMTPENISYEKYKEIQKKYGDVASWAVWRKCL